MHGFFFGREKMHVFVLTREIAIEGVGLATMIFLGLLYVKGPKNLSIIFFKPALSIR